MKAVRILVSGLVQGVGFRWSTSQQARRLGVSGWVRNLDDGRVEAHLQGDDVAVDELTAWIRRGPRAARVESLSAGDVPADDALSGFEERR